MQKRVRCPLCGMLVWGSQVEKYHNIDIKSMEPQGRARGFKYTKSEDGGLVALVRAKIKVLYEKYFAPASSVVFSPGIQSRGGVRVRGGLLLRPSISTATVVRDI
ncbi:hypothetical protein ES703_71415 [subsurface metagenome]